MEIGRSCQKSRSKTRIKAGLLTHTTEQSKLCGWVCDPEMAVLLTQICMSRFRTRSRVKGANAQPIHSYGNLFHSHYWPYGTALWRCAIPTRPLITMNKVLRPLRRAAVYGSFSYLGLVVINNSGLDLPSLWIAYLPMFVGVYALTIWIDQKFSS